MSDQPTPENTPPNAPEPRQDAPPPEPTASTPPAPSPALAALQAARSAPTPEAAEAAVREATLAPSSGETVTLGLDLPPELRDVVIPNPEPARPLESWRDVTPGSPAFPVKLADGRWSAGGYVKDTLCVGPDGRPRCYHASADGRCSGPPTEEMRQSMRGCVAFRDVGSRR